MQEYEKRLVVKDQEVKAAQAALAALRERLGEAQAALADTSRMLPAPEPQPGKSSVQPHAQIPQQESKAELGTRIKDTLSRMHVLLVCWHCIGVKNAMSTAA